MSTDAGHDPAIAGPAGTGQEASGPSPTPAVPVADLAPATGRRPALRGLRRELTDVELEAPGARKLLLDALERADADAERFETYVERYHEAAKRAAVLEERLRTNTSLEVFFGTMTTLGGAIMGVSPLFWDKTTPRGPIALVIGAALIICGAIARIIKR